jgi:hypothetical protein
VTTTPNLPLAELTTRAIRILIQEMGVVNTARFINQYTHGFGDYTVERDELFKDMTVDDIVKAMRQQKSDNEAEN